MGINLHNNSAVIVDNFNSDIYSNGNLAIFGMKWCGKTYTLLCFAGHEAENVRGSGIHHRS